MDVTSQGQPGSLHAPLADALGAALEEGLVQNALIAASGAQAARLWKMRESLYATQYSNLRVVVLNKTRNIQARQFAEMSPTKYGEEQTTFEHIFDWGVALHERALKEGKTVVRAPATSPVHRDENEKEEEEEREREK